MLGNIPDLWGVALPNGRDGKGAPTSTIHVPGRAMATTRGCLAKRWRLSASLSDAVPADKKH